MVKSVNVTFVVLQLVYVLESAFGELVKRNVVCSEVPEMVLSQILGGAYNSRYMSIHPPPEEKPYSESGRKRTTMQFSPFYVDDDFSEVLSDKPAWDYHHTDVEKNLEKIGYLRWRRSPRTTSSRQWECDSVVVWLDLGTDYFPRYLRTVTCISDRCWYGHYKCRPRSFTVKLLKRKKERCVYSERGMKVGLEGLPSDLRQLWVWEERAVNFCCDCAQ